MLQLLLYWLFSLFILLQHSPWTLRRTYNLFHRVFWVNLIITQEPADASNISWKAMLNFNSELNCWAYLHKTVLQYNYFIFFQCLIMISVSKKTRRNLQKPHNMGTHFTDSVTNSKSLLHYYIRHPFFTLQSC